MRAIILAAGMGLRLVQPEGLQKPKCLLRFGESSLLERHLQLLKSAGVNEIVFVLGFKHEQVEAELAAIAGVAPLVHAGRRGAGDHGARLLYLLPSAALGDRHGRLADRRQPPRRLRSVST